MFKATHIVNGTDTLQNFPKGTPVAIENVWASPANVSNYYNYQDEDGILQIIADYGVDEIKEN